jgi:hypothetical protein
VHYGHFPFICRASIINSTSVCWIICIKNRYRNIRWTVLPNLRGNSPTCKKP